MAKKLKTRLNGWKVEFLRRQMRMSKQTLSDKSGLSYKTIRNIATATEAGQEAIDHFDVQLSTISGLAEAFGVPGMSLLEEIPMDPNPVPSAWQEMIDPSVRPKMSAERSPYELGDAEN